MVCRRGNILLMAVFMAVFLFFLSVALVTANRQDLLLALSIDHRLKAQTAARAGSDIALATLRSESNGAARVEGGRLEMVSGASYSTWLEPYSPRGDTDEKPLTWLHSRGRSGFVTADRSFLLEPLSFGIPGQIQLPLLLAKGPGAQLMALGPRFVWTQVAELPRPDTRLAAGGGPLVVMAPVGTAEPPPTIQDFVPVPDANGILRPTLVEQPLTNAQHEHLLYLAFQGQMASWKDIPDPYFLETAYVPPSVDGNPEGGARWVTATVGGQSIEYTESQFQGPRMEWYGLDGPGLAAEEGTVYCHATHYFYRGLNFQNQVTVGPAGVTNNPQVKPAKVFAEPAVLRIRLADLAGGQVKWERVVDLMTVPDPLSEPEIHEGPRPATSSLAVARERVYSFQRDDYRQLLVGGTQSWSPSEVTEGLAQGLCVYEGRVRSYRTLGRLSDGTPRLGAEGLDPWRELRYQHGEVHAQIFVPDSVAVDGRPSETGTFRTAVAELGLTVECDLLPGLNGFASYENSAYSFVRVHRRPAPQSSTLPSIQQALGWTDTPLPSIGEDTLALAHFDGTHWELWPAGLPAYITPPEPSVKRGLTTPTAELQQDFLALAVYDGKEDTVNRYVPVLIRR